jgi:steroid 5-alpha reductase family enzyme
VYVLYTLVRAAGFVVEVVADQQKTIFRADSKNKGRFITSGLWAWSRHPNYAGEIVLWIGQFVLCSSSFSAFDWLCAL